MSHKKTDKSYKLYKSYHKFQIIIGPILIGLSLDLTQHYTVGWLMAALVGGISIPLYLMAKRPEELIKKYKTLASEQA